MARPKKDEPTDQVRLPESFLHRARRVAAHWRMDLGDYLARSHGPQLDRDEAQMLKEIAAERKRREKGQPPPAGE